MYETKTEAELKGIMLNTRDLHVFEEALKAYVKRQEAKHDSATERSEEGRN